MSGSDASGRGVGGRNVRQKIKKVEVGRRQGLGWGACWEGGRGWVAGGLRWRGGGLWQGEGVMII